MSVLFDRPRVEIAPGAVHIPGWLPIERQRKLVAACRDWAEPPAGPDIGLHSGRFNITLRESGLAPGRTDAAGRGAASMERITFWRPSCQPS